MKNSQRFIMLSFLGFAIGVITGTVISTLLGTLSVGDGEMHLCPDALIQVVGNPIIAFVVQAVVSGIFGVLAIGGTFVYGIEEWGLVKCTAIHYFLVMGGYIVTSLFLRWFTLKDIVPILCMIAGMTVGYVIIWFINYMAYKSQLDQINKKLDELKTLNLEVNR